MKEKKRIIILGATGSVGQTVLKEVERRRDLFEVVGISCNNNTELADHIIQQFNVPFVAITGNGKITSKCNSFQGISGLTKLVTEVDFDVLVVAISGINGLKPTLRAIERGKTIILASKEILVEDVAAHYSLYCLLQCVVAYEQVGHEVNEQ